MSYASNLTSLDANLLNFLGAKDVTYTPSVGEAVTVKGLFDDASQLVDPGGEAGLEMPVPMLWLRLAELPGDPMTDSPTITVDGNTYTVYERRSDGDTGQSIQLFLHRTGV